MKITNDLLDKYKEYYEPEKKENVKDESNRLDVSDQTGNFYADEEPLSIITAVNNRGMGILQVLERITMLETKPALTEKDLNQAVEMLTTDLEKNTEFRIKWPRE